MAPNDAQSKISLKLMVHRDERRVIFAEADNNFVDTLFSIITLPLATIVRLLRKVPDDHRLNPIGSLNNLYQSLVDLSTNCLSSEENKWLMLNLKTSSHNICRKLKLNINDEEPTKYFVCQESACFPNGSSFSTCNLSKCSFCGSMMIREIEYEDSTVGDESDGFVSDLTNFIVTDDLCVMPNSPGSIFLLLCYLGITDVSCLVEVTFKTGPDEILLLLKAALLFKNPLTSLVFPNSHVIRDLVNSGQETSFNHLTTPTSESLSLNVFIQKSTSKFLFAEADSDFVEFLFGFLQIPLGYMIGKLMNGGSSLESLNNLYSSISNMRVGEYIKSDDVKNMLIQPQLVHTILSQKQIFPLSVFCDSKTYCRSYLKADRAHWSDRSDWSVTLTRSIKSMKGCLIEMSSICSIKDSRVDGRYLKASAKFVLTDDLVITPLSSFSSITMLSKLNVPLNDVEVHKVSIGIEEGLEILDASLKSSSAFTDSIMKRITATEN